MEQPEGYCSRTIWTVATKIELVRISLTFSNLCATSRIRVGEYPDTLTFCRSESLQKRLILQNILLLIRIFENTVC